MTSWDPGLGSCDGRESSGSDDAAHAHGREVRGRGRGIDRRRDHRLAREGAHPGFTERLLDDDGKLRRFVNVFVADDDVRFLEGLDTKVPDGETVSIVPAVAGG